MLDKNIGSLEQELIELKWLLIEKKDRFEKVTDNMEKSMLKSD